MKTKPKLNVPLLRKIQRAIMQEPKRIVMNDWLIQNIDDEEDRGLKTPDCGTVGCIAGWAAVLHETSDPKNFSAAEGDWPDANTYLGIENGDPLFYPDQWPFKFQKMLRKHPPQTKAYARVVCSRIDHFIKTGK